MPLLPARELCLLEADQLVPVLSLQHAQAPTQDRRAQQSLISSETVGVKAFPPPSMSDQRATFA